MKPIYTFLFSICFVIGYAQPNVLDTSFGNNGEVNIHELFPGVDIKVQPDGKILTIGAQDSMPVINGGYINFIYNVTVARLNSDGSYDTSFGINGFSTVDIDTILFPNTSTSYGSAGCGLAIQADGKILVVGSLANTYGFVTRLNSDGTLDLSFGQGGAVNLLPNNLGISKAFCAKELNNGKIACGGVSNGLGVIRLNSNGNVDNTFGNNGVADTLGINGQTTLIKKLFENGTNVIGIGGGSNFFGDFELHRYRISDNGHIDNTYTNGFIYPVIEPSFTGYTHDAAIDTDGSVYVAGARIINNETGVVYKFKPNGQIDSTFGANGYFINASNPYSFFVGVYIEPSGKLLVAGSNYNTTTDSINFCLYRLNQDGTKDFTYGNNGSLEGEYSIIGNNQFSGTPYSSARQPDGKILIAGKSDFGEHIERFGTSAVNAVDENKIMDFDIYPNPVERGNIISIPVLKGNVTLRIYAIDGKLINSTTNNSIVAPNVPGLYVIQVITNAGMANKKLLVN